MKKILLFVLSTLMFSTVAKAEQFDVESFLNKTYITIGVGYKIKETELSFKKNGITTIVDDPVSARIEIGYMYNRHLRFGVAHYSQYFSGWPVNDDREYHVTMAFVDITFTLNDML